MSFFVPDVKCIPAGFQLLTTSIMICPKHSLEQCSINGNGAIRAESHLHLHLRVQVLARAHDSPASGPGRGIPAATQAKGHLRALLQHARFWMDQPEAIDSDIVAAGSSRT
ncbi:uncharacterized protein LOC128093028 [Culex pipiens pallens]|uniref:uncharacterized protein LOC128093028 n=1 Tax=Culex pipiens pallens TaxID=42434 RepID=UPI0022AA85C5|nr:uncharacterized protein LOC128093028 [Culex pipiens pallens]